MTYSELIALLRTLVSRCGSQKAAADRIGVGLTTLNRTLRRKIAPGDKLLVGMGLTCVFYDILDAHVHFPVVDRIRYDRVMEVK